MRNAVVTGASSGIGKVTAIELARQGFHVVAAGRSRPRLEAVVESIVSLGGSAEFVLLDLSSLSSTRDAARTMAGSGRQFQVMVNNAGVGLGRGVTVDGFELHFGVNHLGHFLLTELLAPALTAEARVVNVSSTAHHRVSGIDFRRVVGPTRSLLGYREYAVSKLANVLFSRELARRRPGLRSYAVHPGLVDTALVPRWVRPFVTTRLLTPEEGAEPVVWCATSPGALAGSGLYFERTSLAEPSAAGADDALAAELWERSMSWSGTASAG